QVIGSFSAADNRVMRRSWALRAAIAILCAIPFAASASGLITQAWHLTFAGASDTRGTNPIAIDRSGNFYFDYVTSNTLHLRKLSPAENLYFDVSVATLPSSLQGIAPLAISPPV